MKYKLEDKTIHHFLQDFTILSKKYSMNMSVLRAGLQVRKLATMAVGDV